MKGVVESLQPVQEQITGVIGGEVELWPGCAHQPKVDLGDKLCRDEVWGG